MKPQTKTLLKVIFMFCLIGGCSRTNRITTPKNSEPGNDEPFMREIKEIATKRERLYFIGQPINKAELEQRELDINFQRDYGSFAWEPREHFEVIPVILIRF